jgi:uncharacterized protein YndB with AHSA1/START domain
MATKKSHLFNSAAVENATGKSWDQWYAILDAAGGAGMTHKQIVVILRDEHGVRPWWQQMVTVGYERARGKRVVHQRPNGFSINRSKTIAVSASKAFAAWKEKRRRDKWLAAAAFIVRKATANKSLRVTWDDGTNLDVQFFPKGKDKCQVAIEHARLKNEKMAEAMKKYWGARLDDLKALLES